MNPLSLLFGQIANTITNHASPNTPGPSYDAGGLLSQLGGLFGQHAQQNGDQFDPGEYAQHMNYNQGGGQFGNVLSSDQDPYGDPGAQGGGQFGNVLSSDQDPYGDPGAQGR